MATKVGEGYIEIKPKLVGFNRDLLRDARARIREIEQISKEAIASVTVRPKIAGITKVWQREIQNELNSKITGLTVDVKVKLENDALKATFNNFTVEAKNAGEKAGSGLSKSFKTYIGDVHRDINSANIAIKSGFKAPDDSGLRNTLEALGTEFKELSEDIDNFSNKEVRAINTAVNSFKTLNNMVGRESTQATREYEKSIESAIRATDRMVERINSQRISDNSASVWNLARQLDEEIRDAETIANHLFPDLNQIIAAQGQKAANSFSGTFGRALKANFFDNLTEGLLALGVQFTVAAFSAEPLLGALSNLSAGLINLGTIVVDVYGAFLALPAVWAAVAQAGAVLTAAFFGIQDALNALQNQEQHAAANAATQARQISAAQERVADAKERVKRVIESVNESIKRSEESLAEAVNAAARRISDAEERVAEAHADAAAAADRAVERIADAQKDLARVYVDSTDRIASAQKRHADATMRVKDAQDDLNRSYRDALERFQDLNIALGNAILDEEGAKLAIERAKEKLDKVLADPNASDLDKREADLAYREALHRLEQIRERQDDLRQEVEEANRSGVEGSKEVTSAREKLLEAQRAEIEAQKAVAKAHEESAERIMDAQDRVAQAQGDAVRVQLDNAKRIQEAERALADARDEGAKDVQRAQDNLAKAHKDAARSIADANKDVKRAIENLTEAQTRQNEQFFNAQYAMSQLSPEAQKFVTFLHDVFIPRLQEVQFAIQDSFFPPIQRALSQSGGLIDLFQQKLTVTAGIFGELIGKTIEWLNTPEVQNRLGNILDTNNRLFLLLGEAGENFGDVLLTLTDEAGPFLEDMGKLVLDFSKWIDDIVNSKEGREELAGFFQNASDTIRDLYDIVKLVGGALYEVYKIARPFGQDLLDDIKDIAKRFNEWVGSPEGNTQIEKFLKNGRDFLREVLKLIEDVAEAFFEFGASSDLSGLVKSLREDLLPALINVIKALGGGSEGGGFIFFIKIISVALNALAANVSLVAAAVGALWGVFTGDWKLARESFATFLDSVSGNVQTVFGGILPDNFAESSKAFNDSIRGMNKDRESLSNDFGQLNIDTQGWANLTDTQTSFAETNFDEMAANVGTSMGRYSTDVDTKTKDAKDKADANSTQTKEAVVRQMEDLRLQNAHLMEEYRRTVDGKTRDAKNDSNRNTSDLVRDAATLLIPFSPVFRRAGEEAQKAIRNPGSSWWDVGAAVINGLWEGVKAWIPNFLTSIWNLGVDIVNTIRRALDSNSPSKKMMMVGKDVGEGLALGVESMAGRVAKASKKLSQSVIQSIDAPSLEMDIGSTGRKVVPTVGTSGVVGASRVYNVTVHAAPTVPTEKQISNVLKYQEALYGND